MRAGAQRIAEAFRHARDDGRAAFIPFLTAGDPDGDASEALVLELARRGADLVEMGIPFSDPVADGPVIQRASRRALAGGFSLRRALDLAARVRRAHPVPLVFMSYANPILRFGAGAFAEAAAGAGVDGLIVPDLPPEEAGDLRSACSRHGIATIFLVAPTTTPGRLPAICGAATGYIYYVALRGVTGVRDALPPDLAAGIARVRAVTDLPVAVGFGVSTPEQVAAVAREADGVIVGSALVRAVEGQVEAGAGRPELVARVGEAAAALRAATGRAGAAGRA